MALVAVTSGGGRYENVRRCLALLEETLRAGLKGKRSILIKPNFVSTRKQLAASHVDACRAVLDAICGCVDGEVTIAEGAAQIPTGEGFKNFGFETLTREYGVRLLDLNTDESVNVRLYGRGLRPMDYRIARSLVESDYRISLALPKTHDTVLVTLGIKNMAVGGLLKDEQGDEKMKLHQGYAEINRSLAELARLFPPSLSVIDGFEAMEGEGPELGNVVRLGWAMAGFDPLAVDTLATHLMGFDPGLVGYLAISREKGLGEGDLERIEAVGTKDLASLKKDLKPHPTYEKQLAWR
jgi:uncharacterized protein (DUF362 family)